MRRSSGRVMDSLELPLDWSGTGAGIGARAGTGAGEVLPTAPASGDAVGPEEVPAWVGWLDDRTRVSAASLARERRPLLFLVDPRNRWHLVEPRLRIAGLDASDLEDRPEGEFRMVVAADTDPLDVANLLRIFRGLRPPRSVVTERVAAEGAFVVRWLEARR